MATAMKANAEAILTAAKLHMQATVFSAANFTAARAGYSNFHTVNFSGCAACYLMMAVSTV